MDTTRIDLFLEVARRGSFAAVARSRSLDPSSVSRAIAQLEADLGVRLLHRSTRALAVTDAGERYIARVTPLLEGLSEAAENARDADAAPRGRVRATVPVSYGLRRIIPRLPEFRNAHPGVQLDLRMTDARLDLLEERLDLAVRLGTLTDPALIARRLHPMRYRCVASPDYLHLRGTPRTIEDLANHDCLTFPLHGRTSWGFRAAGVLRWMDLEPTIACSSTLGLRDLAAAGSGVTVLPEWVMDDLLSSGDLVPVLADLEVTLSDFDASAWLLFPARNYVPARVRVFADWVLSLR